jgi:hypothetical protein
MATPERGADRPALVRMHASHTEVRMTWLTGSGGADGKRLVCVWAPAR